MAPAALSGSRFLLFPGRRKAQHHKPETPTLKYPGGFDTALPNLGLLVVAMLYYALLQLLVMLCFGVPYCVYAIL